MRPYYFTIALVFLFSMIAEKCSIRHNNEYVKLKDEPFSNKIFLFFAAIVLIMAAGCRYYVGTDYGAYYHGLSTYGDRLWDSIKEYDEPGLPVLASIIRLFTSDGTYLVFVCSSITIGLFLFTVYKNESSYVMASLLFIFIGIWHGSFNGVRQYLAAGILFAGHRYIYDRKLWKYFVTVFFATCFHLSAVVMVVLYFLLRNKLTVRNIILLIVGTVIVSANYDAIFSLIGLLKVSDTAGQTAYATAVVNTFRILVACAPAIFCLFIYQQKELTKEQTFYINALIVHGAAMVAASNSAYLARIGIYTSPFAVVGIPKLIHFNSQRIEKLVRIGIVLFYAAYWYIDIKGSSTLREFHWIWER